MNIQWILQLRSPPHLCSTVYARDKSESCGDKKVRVCQRDIVLSPELFELSIQFKYLFDLKDF